MCGIYTMTDKRNRGKYWENYYEDYDRLAQNILIKYPYIEDQKDYEESFDDYLKDKKIPKKSREKLKKGSWKAVFTCKGISPSKRKEIKKGYRSEPEKQKELSKRYEKGELPSLKVVSKKGKMVRYDYTIMGYIKNNIVYGRPIKTKRGTRIIDRKGRYVSTKKRK
jgi:hypothetical protein